MPSVSPVNVAPDPPFVTTIDIPPGFAMTVNPTMGLPPVTSGGLHERATVVSPGTPTTFVGAPGTVAGTTKFESPDGALVPARLTASTVNA